MLHNLQRMQKRPSFGTSLVAKYELEETQPTFWAENASGGHNEIELLKGRVGYIQVVTLSEGIWLVQFLYRDLKPNYNGLGKKMMTAAFRFLIE